MDKIINYLLEEKETVRGKNKELIYSYNLSFKDYRIQAIYKSINNALISIDTANKEKDDIIQELFLGLWKYTPVFLDNEGITPDALLTAIKDPNKNEMAAKYFGYIKIKILGMVKNSYNITNDEEKQQIDEVFFMDLITNGEVRKEGESAIADYLTSNNITVGKDIRFKEWLIRNGQGILTKTQMEYLNTRLDAALTKKSIKENYSFRERISKRILKSYGETIKNNKNVKILEYIDNINLLEDILNSKCFYKKLIEYKDEDLLVEMFTGKNFNKKYLNVKELKELSALLNGKKEDLTFNFAMKLLLSMEIYKNNFVQKLKNRD